MKCVEGVAFVRQFSFPILVDGVHQDVAHVPLQVSLEIKATELAKLISDGDVAKVHVVQREYFFLGLVLLGNNVLPPGCIPTGEDNLTIKEDEAA